MHHRVTWPMQVQKSFTNIVFANKVTSEQLPIIPSANHPFVVHEICIIDQR